MTDDLTPHDALIPFGDVGAERIVPAPTDPMAVARAFVADRYRGVGGTSLLRYWRNTFHRYVGTHYTEVDDHRVQAELWRWLESAVYLTKKGELAPFEPTKYRVANILEALRAIGDVEDSAQTPVWLVGNEETALSAGAVVVLANGIFDLQTRSVRAHTPELFAQHALPFAYEPNAVAPRWERFLWELWGEDRQAQQSKSALAEWFGYVLAGETRQQKAFLLVGPRRSGKGTIARVLTGLLGVHNVAAPTLASLGQNFGLQPLIGKPLAVISDARLGARADSTVAVERLLSITGEDAITIDRKYRDPWTGRLPTRFMVLTNELPRFTDSSGAMASRFVMDVLTRSFYGHENPALTEELLDEAPGIFNWALDGLDRLRERGYFVVPEAAREAQRHLEDLASPVGAFVRDECVVGPEQEVEKDVLWNAWKVWAAEEGLSRPGTKSVFARDLRAAVPGLTPIRPREGERRSHSWRGINLGQQSERPLTIPDHGSADDRGQGSGDPQISLNDAVGQGWSGVGTTVSPESTLDPDEIERYAEIAREMQDGS